MNKSLPGHIPFCQPLNPPFPDHVHRFVTLDGPPSPVERAEALLGIDPPLHRTEVLQKVYSGDELSEASFPGSHAAFNPRVSLTIEPANHIAFR
jgi:hypothetical protein